MKCYILIVTLFLSQTIFAQFRVNALLDQNSHRTHLSLPFLVTNNGSPISVSQVVLENAVNCKSMLDPFKVGYFHVRCLEPVDNLKLTAKVLQQDKLIGVMFSGIKIFKIAEGGIVINPPPTDPIVNPDINIGKTLFGNNCIGCHTNASSKSNRSLEQIKAAIASDTTGMSGIKLTDDQLTKISTYLKSLK